MQGRLLSRQRTILGVLMRDVKRKMVDLSVAAYALLHELLDRVERIHAQTASKANPNGCGKLYALHALEMECIGKGKALMPHEFGVKSSLAITDGQGLIVGALTFRANPNDGHTLAAQLEQTSTLLTQGIRRRCPARGVVRGRLQPTLAAAGHRPQG
jgi:IS5 family transposase